MSEYDEYLLDEDGQPYRYVDGRPVNLEDFDHEDSEKGRDEARSILGRAGSPCWNTGISSRRRSSRGTN